MNRRFFWIVLLLAPMALAPFRAPAPLSYVPGEGWYYESYGETAKWQRTRAKDQLDVAEAAFNKGDYKITLHAAHRILRVWPLSDYAPRAEYLVARCLEERGRDEAAFNAYQTIITKYPRSDSFNDILWREYAIANRFLGGEWFRLWNVIPLYPSMDQTAKLYDKIVNNGPYSEVAPHAQLRIGAAHEKARDFDLAAQAYEKAADRYNDQAVIAADALYREGLSYQKQAATAEYDQSMAGKAIATYTDFKTFYPDDKRVPEVERSMALMKMEQVRGNFKIAQYYESTRRWAGAVVYYNEVLQLDPNSAYATLARQRIEVLKPRLQIRPR
jgi:outer membrane protein assembly factor BamD